MVIIIHVSDGRHNLFTIMGKQVKVKEVKQVKQVSNVSAFLAKLSAPTKKALNAADGGVKLYDLVKEFASKGVHTKPVETPKSEYNDAGIMFLDGDSRTFLSVSLRLAESGFSFGSTRAEVKETYEGIKNDMKVRVTTSTAGNQRFTLCSDGEDLL